MKKYSAVKLLFISVLFSTVLFNSCKSSGGIPIPGEEEYRISNISAEYYQIAKAYFDQKNYSKAIEYYSLAKRDKQFEESSNYQIGVCYVMQKDWNNAEIIFKDILKRDPENSTLKSSIAYIKANSGKFQEAIDLYRELYELYPNESSYLINYITVLIADERYEIASQRLTELKENFPDTQEITAFETKIADGLDPKTEETEENSELPAENVTDSSITDLNATENIAAEVIPENSILESDKEQ